jgi:ABC-type Na+ efflux pump permease subunit
VGKRWSWVAWSILAIFAAGSIVTAALAIPNRSVARDPAGVLYLLVFAAFLVVGALIVARRPDNAIGWLFSAVGLLALSLSLANEGVRDASVMRGPGGASGRLRSARQPSGRALCPGRGTLH